MKKIYIILVILICTINLNGKNFAIEFNKNMKKIISQEGQLDIESDINLELFNFLDKNSVKLVIDKTFDRSLQKGNKSFLRKYLQDNNLDGILVLKYKRVTHSVEVKLFLNDKHSTELINNAFVDNQNYKLSIISSIIKGFSELDIVNINRRRL